MSELKFTTVDAIITITKNGNEHVSKISNSTNNQNARQAQIAEAVDLLKLPHICGDMFFATVVNTVETDHKGFNKKTNCITDGNVTANTMVGSYIRPYNETQCNNVDFKLGELQTNDIDRFRKITGTWAFLMGCRDKFETMKTETTIAYSFFTYTGNVRNEIGSLLVKASDRSLISRSFGLSISSKNQSVLDGMSLLLTNKGTSNKRLVATKNSDQLTVFDRDLFDALTECGIACTWSNA